MFEKFGGIENRDDSGTCWLTYRMLWREGCGSFNFSVRIGRRWFTINTQTQPERDR